jgi:cell division protein FtsL
MSRNRRRHANSLRVSALAAWLVVAFFLTVAGVSYVYLKNQRHTVGKETTRLEREIKELKTRNEVLAVQISTLSSRVALERRIAEGFIKMEPITDDRIVRVQNTGGDRIRAVSNEGNGE